MGVSLLPTLKLLRPTAMIVGTAFVGLLFGYWLNRTFVPGTEPVQPINFSHQIHAGLYQIDCLYCHSNARKSVSAGVPSVNKCVGCHELVVPDRPQIRLVMEYWENQEPIPWVKVHDLPDFVHFPHNRHVAAGLECQECHGPVETMDVVSRQAPVEMGLCLTCHRDHQVEFGLDCLTCHK